MEDKTLIYKIAYCIGVVLACAYVFMEIAFGIILWDCINLDYVWDVAGLMLSFTENQFFANNPEMIPILFFWLPMICLITAGILLFTSLNRLWPLVLGLIGIVVFLIDDLFFISKDLIFNGVYINITGIAIACIGLCLATMTKEILSDSKSEENSELGGIVQCLGGEFAGGFFGANDTLIIGKEPSQCNLILCDSTISRIHCVIKYMPETNTYAVKDLSMNGTYLENGQRLIKNYEMQLPQKTVLRIGKEERFLLS